MRTVRPSSKAPSYCIRRHLRVEIQVAQFAPFVAWMLRVAPGWRAPYLAPFSVQRSL
jgi:hypothetical protein